MNREIKFRAWVIETTQMLYDPYYFQRKLGADTGSVPYDIYEDWRDLEDGRSWTGYIMQYTGLKDKNGKEIYEGDIIRSVSFNKRKLCAVIFKEGSFVKFNECELSTSTHGLSFHKDNEVIGNIYETPTLLEPNPTDYSNSN